MGKHIDTCTLATTALAQHYALSKDDLGSDARFAGRGMTFDVASGEIGGIGHYCTVRMKAPLGLMRMETVIIAPTQVDAPLFNMDWVKAFGMETQIAEFYDDQLNPWPQACQGEFERISQTYDDLPDAPETDERWYSSILYPFSCHKKGKGLSDRFSALAQDYIASYVAQLSAAAPCDSAEKREKVRAFAQRLYDEGGPAVDFVTKNFGADAARRLVLRHMYGVDDVE